MDTPRYRTTTAGLRHALILGAVSSSLCLAGCEGKGKDDAPAPGQAQADMRGHYPIDEVESALPDSIGTFHQKSVKLKTKSPAFYEYSATYSDGAREVKLVVNDWLPSRDENDTWKPDNWSDSILSSGQKTGGHPSLTETKEDKHTVMILLSPRMRVDFKSRELAAEQLAELAASVDIAQLGELAKRPQP